MAYLNANGFTDAIQILYNINDTLLINESSMYKVVNSTYEKRDDVKAIKALKANSYNDSLIKLRHSNMVYKLKNANTIPKLAQLIGDIENSILYEKLDPDFLTERLSFYQNLLFYSGMCLWACLCLWVMFSLHINFFLFSFCRLS